jgi:hypothetical protein
MIDFNLIFFLATAASATWFYRYYGNK